MYRRCRTQCRRRTCTPNTSRASGVDIVTPAAAVEAPRTHQERDLARRRNGPAHSAASLVSRRHVPRVCRCGALLGCRDPLRHCNGRCAAGLHSRAMHPLRAARCGEPRHTALAAASKPLLAVRSAASAQLTVCAECLRDVPGRCGHHGRLSAGLLGEPPANRAVHGSQRHKIHSVRICRQLDLLGRGASKTGSHGRAGRRARA